MKLTNLLSLFLTLLHTCFRSICLNCKLCDLGVNAAEPTLKNCVRPVFPQAPDDNGAPDSFVSCESDAKSVQARKFQLQQRMPF